MQPQALLSVYVLRSLLAGAQETHALSFCASSRRYRLCFCPSTGVSRPLKFDVFSVFSRQVCFCSQAHVAQIILIQKLFWITAVGVGLNRRSAVSDAATHTMTSRLGISTETSYVSFASCWTVFLGIDCSRNIIGPCSTNEHIDVFTKARTVIIFVKQAFEPRFSWISVNVLFFSS